MRPHVTCKGTSEEHVKQKKDGLRLDCKTVGFFLRISKEIVKAWRKSLTRAKRASFSLIPDLLFDCSRVLEYAKIRTVLQSSLRLSSMRLCNAEKDLPKVNSTVVFLMHSEFKNLFHFYSSLVALGQICFVLVLISTNDNA